MSELLVPVIFGVGGGLILWKVCQGKTFRSMPHVSIRREMNDHWRNRVDPNTPISSTNVSDYNAIDTAKPYKGADGLIRLPDINRNNATIIQHPYMRSELVNSKKLPMRRKKNNTSSRDYTMPRR